MRIEEIKGIIGNYENLVNLVKDKVKILEENDFEVYTTSKGIEEITFDNDRVVVKCDDSFRGSGDIIYFSFPLSYLTLTNEELEEVVLQEKANREEIIRLKEEAQKQKEREKDLKEYQILKAKLGL